MKILLFLFIALFSVKVFAIGCDCEVRVYSPIRGSHEMPANTLKIYELEEFNTYSFRNQKTCRALCLEAFEEDMPSERLTALLTNYTQTLIHKGLLGYNCTGLTVAKYPVRVKANLGQLGLGNVVDIVQVVPHEEQCF